MKSNQVCINKVETAKKCCFFNVFFFKNSADTPFVNLMQDEITSDDSVIRHHYQRRGGGRTGRVCFGAVAAAPTAAAQPL